MRAGQLRYKIFVERSTETVGEDGTVTFTWTDLHTLRAEMVDIYSQEFRRTWGDSSEEILMLRTRYVDDLTVADRVMFDNTVYNIKKIQSDARRRELQISLEAVGP